MGAREEYKKFHQEARVQLRYWPNIRAEHKNHELGLILRFQDAYGWQSIDMQTYNRDAMHWSVKRIGQGRDWWQTSFRDACDSSKARAYRRFSLDMARKERLGA